METAPLKNFATWARNALIREVNARIAAVLAPGSSDRVEQSKAIAALDRAVAAAGGGEEGRAAVAEKVAYTWFNRIIALRFMDANGYTGIGVVSPQAGIEVGQPEILAEAKRGVIDTEVASQETRTAVARLLDGTRTSSDPQSEAYALLLADYCRYWNRAMPFMFEREGDYTELLIPANLLADDSVLNRSVTVLTQNVCKDVEVIGWLYQFYISERKDDVFAGFKKNRKAGAAEIPAATQLFTPHWIVRYLVENSLGRLWMLNRPSSGLVNQMDYYIAPVDQETDFLKITKPEELKVIDPACGSGHMLTYAFDLLYAIYEEEGYGPAEIPSLILTHNLYGTEIDPRAGALAAFALTMKARAKQRTFFNRPLVPSVLALEPITFDSDEVDALIRTTGGRPDDRDFWLQFERADLYGSLIKSSAAVLARLDVDGIQQLSGDLFAVDLVEAAETVVHQALLLSQTYHVLIANPPYMGSKNMDARLAAWAKTEYPETKSDLFSMFMDRAFDLVSPRGYAAMVTMEAWMFLSSYKELRGRIIDRKAIRSMVHMPYLGKGSTSMGINFGTSATVISNGGVGDLPATFQCVRYFETDPNGVPLEYPVRNERFAEIAPAALRAVPDSRVAYWLSDAMLKAFTLGRPLAEVGDPRQGMATADNGRFLRLWSEVSGSRFGRDMSREEAAESRCKWYPYNKGGDFRKWYGNQEWVVNWANGGAELMAERPKAVIRSPQLYFKPSVSWSKVGSGVPAFRYFPKGFLFDVAGTSIFSSEQQLLSIAGICNSAVVRDMLAATSPTLNVEVGTLAQIPIIDLSAEAIAAVQELIAIHQADWDSRETSWGFERLDLVRDGSQLVASAVQASFDAGIAEAERARDLEMKVNAEVAAAYGLSDEVDLDVPLDRVTLHGNSVARFGAHKEAAERRSLYAEQRAVDLVSYAVGCMFGRYSLDEAGLILVDQGNTLQDYLEKVASPNFTPDADNVIPIVEGDWFEDDIVERFRQFLRAAFGEQHFEENLRFVTESLGVKTLRDYFITRAGRSKFYDDHIQRYKKRPIYWLFSSPKGSFNALIYMHRYSPSTASTVLNEYLREFQAKLKASLEHAERSNNAKEADRLRKMLLELGEYEHDVLYPLASQSLAIDLDDGVKANYPKFGTALRKIAGLEATE